MSDTSSSQGVHARPLLNIRASLFGLFLFAIGAGAAAIALSPLITPRPVAETRPPEAERFAAQYGPGQYSQFGEEWLIRDFFQDRRGGTFVDVGASHYQEFNNTFYLEAELGWSGLAIDPLEQFEEGYRRHRPRTRFFPLFVSDRSDEQARIYFLKDRTRITSSDAEFTAKYGGDGAVELITPTVTLDDLLTREGITKVDFLSMDIELAEPQALAGFNIQRFRPDLVCIEAHEEVRQAILDYFTKNSYVVVGKYLKADTQNLYFMPLGFR